MKTWNYIVKPHIPERLIPLQKIAYNLWFSWNYSAVELFMRLGREEWHKSYQNPVRMLGMIPQERYEEVVQDDSFISALDMVDIDFRSYMHGETWFQKNHPEASGTIAYFSFEFGLDEGLPVYSGGLGILAGDHLKSASDLGIPLVGVGLLYREGYFRQYLNADGYQQEEYPENDWYTMPVSLVTNEDGTPIKSSVDLPDGTLNFQIWKVQVGRICLYLLDANLPENSPEFRGITDQLYGGDSVNRIRQEVLLGIGGLRALWAMGIEPSVCHMNEGHSAFLALERVAHFMEKGGLSFEQASELVWASNVFTTHTPVPAGNERFDPALVEKYLSPYLPRLGIGWDKCVALGRENPSDHNQAFCMTVLALRLAAHCNGVAKLHGDTSRKMWQCIWPELPEDEVPIGHITNGIHVRGWLSHDMNSLFQRYLGPKFVEDPSNLDIFDRIEEIPDAELWRTHERRRERLVSVVRKRVGRMLEKRGASGRELAYAEEVLDPDALTIGFARRFATYKRGTLLFRDSERLEKMLNDSDRPIQLVFAGKSHPHDEPGKALIREIVHHSREPRFRGKIIFLEDYDIAVARYLTQGVDIWLNTPRRPLEASGTSGMKAAVGGALNASILDGWWDEAYEPEVGFAIGNREVYNDVEMQDKIESEALYDLLEQDIIPTFYRRGRDGLPRDWISKMKGSMSRLGKFFNTNRMLMDYTNMLYLPAMKFYGKLEADELAQAKEIAQWKVKMQREWALVGIRDVQAIADETTVDDCMNVTAEVNLGTIAPEEVSVELYYGPLDSHGKISEAKTSKMEPSGDKDGATLYNGCIPCGKSGRFGYSVRILPRHDSLANPYIPGLVRWA